MVQTECCICRSWKNKNSSKWYYPSREERQKHYFENEKYASHGYCPECNWIEIEREGASREDTSKIVQLVRDLNINGITKFDD